MAMPVKGTDREVARFTARVAVAAALRREDFSMDMNRLTVKAQEAFGEAQNIALMRNHQEVDVEHLALALVRQKDGLVPGILGRMNAKPEVIAAELEQALDKKEDK